MSILNHQKTEYKKEVEVIKWLFERTLANDYVTEGPVSAAGGTLVMYVWPKNDPSVKKLIEDRGRIYEQVAPGIELHRRDMEDTHDPEI